VIVLREQLSNPSGLTSAPASGADHYRKHRRHQGTRAGPVSSTSIRRRSSASRLRWWRIVSCCCAIVSRRPSTALSRARTVPGSGPGPDLWATSADRGAAPSDTASAGSGPRKEPGTVTFGGIGRGTGRTCPRGTITRTIPSLPTCRCQLWRRASRLAEASDIPLASANSPYVMRRAAANRDWVPIRYTWRHF
jgi:hypothetical protein